MNIEFFKNNRAIRDSATWGTHCENHDYSTPNRKNLYIKISSDNISFEKFQQYRRESAKLKEFLGEIMPEVLFVRGKVNNVVKGVIITKNINIVTDIISEDNSQYVLEILKKNKKTREQLAQFLEVFDELYLEEGKVIDISNVHPSSKENLVLDNEDNVKYVDSFEFLLNENEHGILFRNAIKNAKYLRELLFDAE